MKRETPTLDMLLLRHGEILPSRQAIVEEGLSTGLKRPAGKDPRFVISGERGFVKNARPVFLAEKRSGEMGRKRETSPQAARVKRFRGRVVKGNRLSGKVPED